MNRTFPASVTGLSIAPYNITGTEYRHLGVPLVVHLHDSQWCVSEPTTGRNITRNHRTARAARDAAATRIDLNGGLPALLGAMAGCRQSLGDRQVSDASHAYQAGGPLDAPELMPAGSVTSGNRWTPRGGHQREIHRS